MGRIRVYGEDVLRKKAEEIRNMDAEVRKLIKNMLSTMTRKNGLGLAAPQIGAPKRIFLALNEERSGIITAINPVLADAEGEEIDLEGCLSFPEAYFSIQRARKAVLKAYDEKGKEFIIEAEGLLARCFQHEMDHLNGKLIIDYATDEEKKVWREKIKNSRKSS
ncbi:MAG: peptide deformylase [Candidatus Omnitrophica bacterium]|nr:peptide deformylase [Candidatus Omnitrophota bacterium]